MRTQNFSPTASLNAERLARFQQQMADYARGQRLRELRERKHESQESVAYELGVSTKTLRAWEHGGKIRWDNAKKLAAYYEVDPELLVSRETFAPEEEEPLPGSQLDRIESTLTELLDRLEQAGILRPVDGSASSARAARRVGEEVAHIQETIASQRKPKPGQQAKPRAAPKRKTA